METRDPMESTALREALRTVGVGDVRRVHPAVQVGACALHRLERAAGDTTFWLCVQQWRSEHASLTRLAAASDRLAAWPDRRPLVAVAALPGEVLGGQAMLIRVMRGRSGRADSVSETLARAMGEMMGRMFRRALDDFGIVAEGGRFVRGGRSWKEAWEARVRRQASAVRRVDPGKSPLVEQLLERISLRLDSLDTVERFTLVQGRLKPEVVIQAVSPSREMGIVDWTHSLVGDPLIEWVPFLGWPSRQLEAVIAGFGPHHLSRALDGDGMERLSVYEASLALQDLLAAAREKRARPSSGSLARQASAAHHAHLVLRSNRWMSLQPTRRRDKAAAALRARPLGALEREVAQRLAQVDGPSVANGERVLCALAASALAGEMTQERSGPLCAVAHGWLEELGEGEDSEPDCLQPTAPSWTERVRQVLDDEGQAGWCPYGLLLVAWMARARHWMEPMDPEAERQFTALVDRLRAHARAMPVASGNVDEVLRGGVRLAALLLLQEAGIDGVAVEAQVFASRARWFSDCRRLLGEEAGSGRKTIAEVLPRVQLGVGTQADSLFVVFLDALVQIEREGGLPACPEALIARVYGDAVLAAP